MAITIYSGSFWYLPSHGQAIGRSKRGDNVITLHPSREHDLKLMSYNKRNNKMRKNLVTGRTKLTTGEASTYGGIRIIGGGTSLRGQTKSFAYLDELAYWPVSNTKDIKKANKRKKQARARTGRR